MKKYDTKMKPGKKKPGNRPVQKGSAKGNRC